MPEQDLAAAKQAVAAMTGGNGGFDKKEAAAFLNALEKEHAGGVQDISVWDTVGQHNPELLARILKTKPEALKGINRKISDWQNYSALHRAASSGFLECAHVLLDNRAEIHSKDEDGATPLHLAVLNSDIAMVEKLMEFHAGVNVRDNDGTTPMMIACNKGNIKLCELLLKHGGKLDVRDHAGYSVLHCAVASGEMDVLQLLLRHSSDVAEDISMVDEDGLSMLHICAASGHTDMLRVLLEHGADAQVEHSNGKTPLLWAEEEFEDEAAEILKAHIKTLPEEEQKDKKKRQLWNPDKMQYQDAPEDGEAFNYAGAGSSEGGGGGGGGPSADDIQGMMASLKEGASPEDLMKQMEEKMNVSTGAKMAAHNDAENKNNTPLFAQLVSDAQGGVETDRKGLAGGLGALLQPAAPPAAPAGNTNDDDNDTPFIAAPSFSGSKEGHVFTTGSKGTGYYQEETAKEPSPSVCFTAVDELD